jgi:hypothetical protein
MTDSDSKSSYDRILALGTVILAVASVVAAVASVVAVVVTLRTANEQNSIADAQSKISHALEFATIYFSAPLTGARETIWALYFESYTKKIKTSRDANLAVANLIRPNSAEEHSLDRLIALYDAISACANKLVCSVPIVQSLYGSEIELTYLDWYGYLHKRRKDFSTYGCEAEQFLQAQNMASADVSCSK